MNPEEFLPIFLIFSIKLYVTVEVESVEYNCLIMVNHELLEHFNKYISTFSRITLYPKFSEFIAGCQNY